MFDLITAAGRFSGLTALVVALLMCALPGTSCAEPRAGQLLRDALLELNARGAALVFSSELVGPRMRVKRTPRPAPPLETAREILAPYGLELSRAPGPVPRWLVVRAPTEPDGEPDREPPAPPQPTRAEAPVIEEVLVTAGRYRIYGDDAAAEFDHDEVDRLPHLADDLMRAIGRLPAVATEDFSARINLRGGTREETAVYLDGLELTDPFHLKDLQGALSIVDSNLIDRVDVLPGGFPAVYGDEASGIVRVQTLPPPERPVHSVGVSFVNAFVNTRGAFADGGGWLVSLRRGYLDWLFQLVDTGSGEFTPRYLDFLAKVERELGDRHGLAAHVLAARDDLEYFDNSEDSTTEGHTDTLFLWARLSSRWSESLSSETVLWRNIVDRERLAVVNDPGDIAAVLGDLREIETLGLRSDWQWRLDDGWTVGFGLEATDRRVDYDYALSAVTITPGFPGRPPIDRRTLTTIDGATLGLYASVRKQLGPLAVEFGARRDRESYTGLDQTVWSPRLNLRYDLGPDTKLLAAWGDYHQFQPIEALQVEDGIEHFFPALLAEHRTLGFEHHFDAELSLRADVYRKRYRNLRPRFVNLFDSYEAIPEAEPDRYRVDATSAAAHGIEVTLKRRPGSALSWWVSYTYSKVEDRVGGADVPREWDQPHALSAVLNWQGARWNFNLASSWHRGWPRTDAVVGVVDTPDGESPGIAPGARNAGRYEDYLRVDARASRNLKLKRGEFTYFLELYNVFDTGNACCIDEAELLPGPTLLLREENWLPRVPSFGFTWTFG